MDHVVAVRRRSLRSIEILQRSLENYLGSSFTEAMWEFENDETG
jgi:hypothetical protein